MTDKDQNQNYMKNSCKLKMIGTPLSFCTHKLTPAFSMSTDSDSLIHPTTN